MLCALFRTILFTALLSSSFAKVDPPNYNFSLDNLQTFAPGSPLAAMEEKFGKGELLEDGGDLKTYKFYVAQIRYKFPVFVQLFKGKSLDFYARLPSYFSHDLFHQSIINRYGKQDKYFKQENNAVYRWLGRGGNNYIYSGSCTITCFPIYFSTIIAKPPVEAGGYNPLINKYSGIQAK